MTPLTVGPLSLHECDAAGELIGAVPLWRDRYHHPPSRAAQDLREALSRSEVVLAARRPELAGIAWVMPRGTFGRAPYLKLIAVAPDAQGQHVGAELLEAAVARFQGTAKHFYLLVSDFNRDAQRFYKRHGFTQAGALPDFVLPGVSELLFVRAL